MRNVELALELEPELPRAVLDPIELEQVLVNLITNSIQAMAAGGTIRVRARPAADEVVLEVVDNGPGMPPEVLERVFEPFFTTKPVGQGTGLGLSVCYGLVRSWGGRIEVGERAGTRNDDAAVGCLPSGRPTTGKGGPGHECRDRGDDQGAAGGRRGGVPRGDRARCSRGAGSRCDTAASGRAALDRLAEGEISTWWCWT